MARRRRDPGQPRGSKYSSVEKGLSPVLPDYDIERWDDLQGRTGKKPASELRDFMALYNVHPWVYTCIMTIANAVCSVGFKILKNGEEAKDNETKELIRHPNPHQTWYEFLETTIMYLELVGNSFWEEVKNLEGNLVAIFPLRPDRMKIMPHPKYKIAGYKYLPERGGQILYTPEEITHIKYPNPLDEYWGIGPSAAAQNSLTLDFWSIAYNKGYFMRGAEPGVVLETDRFLSEQAYNRLLDNWEKRHKGVNRSHRPAILEEGLKYKAIDNTTHKDMQFIEIRNMSREEVLAAWRVPPAMVGLLSGASYATAREQRKTFWMENILPKLSRIEDVINTSLMPGELEFKFKSNAIPSIVEDEQVAAEIVNRYISLGIITINEARKKYLNLEPVAWGDVAWMPVGLAPVDSGAHASTPAGTDPATQTPEGLQSHDEMRTGTKGPNFVPKPTEQISNRRGPESEHVHPIEKHPFEAMTIPDPDWDDPKQVWLWTRWNVWKQNITPEVKSLEREIKTNFQRQMQAIRNEFQEHDWIKPTEKGAKKIAKADVPPSVERKILAIVDANAPQLKDLLLKQAEKIMKKQGTTTLGEFGLSGAFDVKNPAVQKYLEKYAAQRVSNISEFTKDQLRRQLAEAASNGEGYKETMARLANTLDGPMAEFRARRIGRTEVVTLTNQAKLIAAKKSGVVEKKIWISELLDSTRDSHKDVHAKKIGIDKTFKVRNRAGGFDEMDGPGDISANPENLVNCLCVLDFPPTTPEFADLFQEEAEPANA